MDDIRYPQAEYIELARRTIIDVFRASGCRQVMPALLEYASPLVQTTDSMRMPEFATGKMVSLRTDMTQSMHRMVSTDVSYVQKLCYVGSVVRMQPTRGSKTYVQAGAEIIGTQSLEADIQILHMVVQVLRRLSVSGWRLVVGNFGFFDCLADLARISIPRQRQLRRLIASKNRPQLQQYLEAVVPNDIAQRDLVCRLFAHLCRSTAYAGCATDVLDAFRQLSTLTPLVQKFEQTIDVLTDTVGLEHLIVDIGDMYNQHYHSGLVFRVMHEQNQQPIACGGQYVIPAPDKSQALDATGVSFDVVQISQYLEHKKCSMVWVDYATKNKLQQPWIDHQRRRQPVIVACTDNESPPPYATHTITFHNDQPQLVKI